MPCDDELHPGHHSIRLQHRDYGAPGDYFVTFCAYEKKCVFGRIAGGAMALSPLGQIVHECWTAIPLHFPNVRLPALVVMPNHVHGVIEIVCQAGAQHAEPLQEASDRAAQVRAGSLAAMVRSLKAAVTKRARAELRYAEEIWQRNYFERVLRGGQDLADTCRYILENPMKWEFDRENPGARNLSTAGQAGAQHAAPLQRRGSRL
jgi:REP element-mobilizing transposase RayT